MNCSHCSHLVTIFLKMVSLGHELSNGSQYPSYTCPITTALILRLPPPPAHPSHCFPHYTYFLFHSLFRSCCPGKTKTLQNNSLSIVQILVYVLPKQVHNAECRAQGNINSAFVMIKRMHLIHYLKVINT